MNDSTLHAIDFTSALATAALASFHCAGMCGGFAIGACAGRRYTTSALLYHLAKLTVYLAIGALVGVVGVRLGRAGVEGGALRWLAIGAGAVMVLVGAASLGLWPRRWRLARVLAGSDSSVPAPLRTVAGCAASYRGSLQAMVLGTLSGLLPCPLVYAFAAKAVASGSMLGAMSTMAALGLGTAPVLLVVAASGRIISPLVRERMVRLSGAFLVALGVFTWWRGLAAASGCCAGHF